VIPDSILAVCMLISALMLWFDWGAYRCRLLAAACAGASLFLGVLDLSYGFSTGIYQINHSFAGELLSSGLSITVVGLIGIVISFMQPSSTSTVA